MRCNEFINILVKNKYVTINLIFLKLDFKYNFFTKETYFTNLKWRQGYSISNRYRTGNKFQVMERVDMLELRSRIGETIPIRAPDGCHV